jgi:addiction module HigA family antidote
MVVAFFLESAMTVMSPLRVSGVKAALNGRGERYRLVARVGDAQADARPVHPGEVLREEFLRPAGLTANALARILHVPAPRINDIVRERRGVSADTAMRLARYFGGDAHSWLNLQAIYDLRLAEIANARKIDREIMPIAV